MILHTTASNASWVITVTLLAAAVAMPVTGRLGDLYGKRPVMFACTIPPDRRVGDLRDGVVPVPP